MKLSSNKSIFVIVLVLIAILFMFFYSSSSKDCSFLKKCIQELEGVEIREYEGKDLSSVYDFRENSIKGIQYVDISDYRLKIWGLVEKQKEYTYDEVIDRKSYSKVVRLDCVEGWSATILWEGIILRELLEESKPLPEAKVIIFHAEDGYTTSYPIEYIMEQDILMAYKMNNETMIPDRGYPFQLVAEDKWGYKWIKWITEIEFSDDLDYKGYWESRGYSKEGNRREFYLD
jgi:DMSO/TMAO reductase YedYZ molybdopterin-dependent catalytic subunit